ncbi:MAG TPA: hypothetical protein VF090_08245 [Methyloceanibacter sp.]
MANANATNKLSILQRMYGPDMAEHEFDRDPYSQEMKKDTGGFGEGRHIVVRTSQIGGFGPDFSRALANKKPAGEKRFFVTEKKLYGLFGIDGLFMRKAKGKPNSLIKGFDGEMRSALRRCYAELDRQMWGDAGGTLGQLSASVTLASTTVLFRTAKQLFGIYGTNARIAFSSDNGTGTSPAGLRGPAPDVPTLLDVVGESWDANTMTTTQLINTVPGATVNDFVFFDGYYASAMTGKRGWNPVTAPTAGDSFFGVDRSTSPQLLSGWRATAQASRELTAINALTLAAQAGVMASGLRIYANLIDWQALVIELGAKYQRQPTDSKQVAGAKGIEVYGPKGTATVFGSNLVPAGNAWLGDPKSDTLLSEGPIPDVLDEDGLGKIVRSPTDDSYDTRLGGYANPIPNDSRGELGPGGWVIITW